MHELIMTGSLWIIQHIISEFTENTYIEKLEEGNLPMILPSIALRYSVLVCVHRSICLLCILHVCFYNKY